MANELRISAELLFADGAITAKQAASDIISPSTPRVIQKRVTVTTSAAALDFTGLTAAKELAIKNLDDTNFVDIGPDDTGMVGLIRLEPGRSCFLPLKPSTTIMAQADTASCEIQLTAADT